ncbi:DNA polymerase III subunit chi [Kaarinaea lacus]
MTKVDFYILKSGSPEHTACKLAEKAFLLGHRIYLHTESDSQARQLDEMLWTFRAGSFIPHQRYEQADEKASPVLVGNHESPEIDCDVLINLANDVPLFFSRFDRVAEVIGGDDAAKASGRERFRFYRDRGYSLNTHEL